MKTWIRRTIFGLAFCIFIMLSSFHPSLKVNFESNSFRNFTGLLKENNVLSESDHLFQGMLKGPESIVFHEGFLYTGLEDGRIVKIKNGKITTVARTGEACSLPYEELKCGRPLGLRIGNDGLLYFCDAIYGIFSLNLTTGALNNILPNGVVINNQRLKFPDDLDIDNRGNIYFTDATTKWDISSIYNIIIENEAGGRVIRYNLFSRETEVLAKNLKLPAGLQISKDGKSLLVSEFMNRRILRLYVKGEKKGNLEVFADALPAEPDNIRQSLSGGYWVGFSSARNLTNLQYIDYFSKFSSLTRFCWRLHALISSLLFMLSEVVNNTTFKVFAYKLKRGDFLLSLIQKHAIVIEFEENGQILRSFHSPEGRISYISEVKEHDGYLYFGSFFNNYLGRLRL